MSRIVTGAVATLGLMAFSIPSHAAITIDGVTYDGLTVSGTYQPGEDISGYGNWGDVPHLNEVIPITHGRYRFDLKTSTPVNLLDGTIYNLYWIDYTCIPEDLGYEVYCGDNDYNVTHPLKQNTSRHFATAFRIREDWSRPYHPNDPEQTIEHIQEFCCGFSVVFKAKDPQASGTWTLTASPVPEPATWAMMLLGFGAVGSVIRRDRRNQNLRYKTFQAS